MSNNFDELVRLLPQYQHPVDSAFLHGLLTGCATIPTVNYERLFDTIAPKQPLPEDAVESLFDSIDQIAEALSVATFEPRFDIRRKGEAQGWLEGYLQAVAIHEKDWQALNEVHTDAAASLVVLNTMSNGRLHRELQMDMPGPKDLEGHPELLSTW